MPIAIVFTGVLLLLLLITVGKLNAFIAFILVALFVGVAQGLPVLGVVGAIQKGIGDTLSSLVMILGFGAMLGKLVADSGAAQHITQRLVAAFGLKYVHWTLMFTGLIVGIPMFYNVGFVIMVPLVFTVAASTGLPLLYVGLPMLASLSVTHGFLPPHPSPTAIAGMFKADMGKTLLLGLVLSIPTAALVVPVFSKRSKKYDAKPRDVFKVDLIPGDQLPSLGISLFAALLPVLLIGISALVRIFTGEQDWIRKVADIAGDPVLAMLISVLAAIYFLGVRRGKKMQDITDALSDSVAGIAMVLLVLGGAGALKQVLVESGVSNYIGELMKASDISPLVLAWLVAAVIRVCVGSATVAGMTAAGIVLPIVSLGGVSPELMVLSIGAGSIFFSHVNDGGFWMFKEYFNLSIKETLATWSMMETTVSVAGLIGVLVLDIFV
ncbi:MAG: gluconate transporter [Lewinellaceae bacterium]|nr:gluconate transporter [Lewinellaceae bacterium]